MSAEEPGSSSHHIINPAARRKNLVDNSSAIDFAASSMGASQAIIVRSAQEEVGKSMNVEKKKTKEKIFLLPQEKLDYYLSIRLKPVPRRLMERDPTAAAEKEKLRERILAEQERMRREYEAKGYATYIAEVPDDGARYEGELGDVDEEEKDAAAVVKQSEVVIDERKEEDASVVTQAGVTEKDAVKQAEVIIDENKEEDAAAAEAEVTDGAAPLNFPQGRGRRRFRPGVVKQAGGGVKKIIM